MFRAASGFGEIAVGVFQERVLVAMAKLIGQAGVAIVMVVFRFGCAFGTIGIVRGDFRHKVSRSESYLSPRQIWAG